MKRTFNEWLDTFRDKISSYDYYVNFDKVYKNVDSIKVELNIMNSLIGSKDIEKDFTNLLDKYPEILKCIPILLAVRGHEIYALDNEGEYNFNFNRMNYEVADYINFMRKAGLFDLLSNHIIRDLKDYVTGVETGLDSNGRKNRGGHLMEDLVEGYLVKAGLEKGNTYFKELRSTDIEKLWGMDLSAISNKGKTKKRFDFVVKINQNIYAIETNFYAGGGSKLNETARSYKALAIESKQIENFNFVWVTDGRLGWNSARHNLEETFDVLDNMYNIKDLESGVFNSLFM